MCCFPEVYTTILCSKLHTAFLDGLKNTNYNGSSHLHVIHCKFQAHFIASKDDVKMFYNYAACTRRAKCIMFRWSVEFIWLTDQETSGMTHKRLLIGIIHACCGLECWKQEGKERPTQSGTTFFSFWSKTVRLPLTLM